MSANVAKYWMCAFIVLNICVIVLLCLYFSCGQTLNICLNISLDIIQDIFEYFWRCTFLSVLFPEWSDIDRWAAAYASLTTAELFHPSSSCTLNPFKSKCDQCNTYFDSSNELEKHMKYLPECGVCSPFLLYFVWKGSGRVHCATLLGACATCIVPPKYKYQYRDHLVG